MQAPQNERERILIPKPPTDTRVAKKIIAHYRSYNYHDKFGNKLSALSFTFIHSYLYQAALYSHGPEQNHFPFISLKRAQAFPQYFSSVLFSFFSNIAFRVSIFGVGN